METSKEVCNGSSLGKIFHKIVENSLKKSRSNNNGKFGLLQKAPDTPVSKLNSIELELNIDPSSFSAYAHVRKLVLRDQAAAAKKGIELSKLLTSFNLDSPEEHVDTEDIRKNPAQQIPQVVVISLRSIFDLIRESRISHPVLCHKVLKALLDILQNLPPESLLSEPVNVVDPLFELLLDISTCNENEGDEDQGKDSLASISASCLLSLVIAWGITPKLLQSLTALIVGPRSSAMREIALPNIMLTLQKCVQTMVNESPQVPDWFSLGIQAKTLVTSFSLLLDQDVVQQSIACDGLYLYLQTSQGLFKVGTGFGGTVSAQIYGNRKKSVDSSGRLLFINEHLYLKQCKDRQIDLSAVDSETLQIKGSIQLPYALRHSNIFFADGSQLGTVHKTADDEFVASLLDITGTEMYPVNECRLRLALQSLYVIGTVLSEENARLRQMRFDTNDGFTGIVAGKEYLLMTSASGKIWYQGKASSLGLKVGLSEVHHAEADSSNRWAELPLPKCPKITQCATGHEGQHSLLLDENGAVYFVGLARRGEDGDLTKYRRQPKASRPKRFASMEGRTVVHIACNNGSSAIVTKEGELFMFGKDSSHCDSNTGRMLALKDVHVVFVALGKAHGVALTDKGQVYTFGINNKGQCGRDGPPSSSPPKPSASHLSQATIPLPGADAIDDEVESEDSGTAPENKLCTQGEHRWSVDQCMICTKCNQCTGFGSTCVNSDGPGRLPGTFCGCGSGESGCTKCGVCRTCAREPHEEGLGLPPAPVPALPLGAAAFIPANGGVLMGRLVRAPGDAFPNAPVVDFTNFQLLESMERRIRGDPIRVEAFVGAALNAEAANRRHRHRRRHPSEVKASVRGRGPEVQFDMRKGGVPGSAVPLKNGPEVVGSDGDRDANKLTSLAPGLINLPNKVRVIQVACGLQHTVLLTSDRQVYAFGSNNYGQLGVGDLSSRGCPTLVKVPANMNPVMITAGSHHSALLTSEGEVLSWGAHLKGQLGRDAADSEGHGSSVVWHSVPGYVCGLGSKFGKKATWIGASGDQTFIKLDESLVNEEQLFKSTVLSTQRHFVILPTHSNSSFHNLVINKADGLCRSFSGGQQVDFSNTLVTWDPLYGILWSVCKKTATVRGYNVFASGLVHPLLGDSMLPLSNEMQDIRVADIFRPSLALPVKATAKVTQRHAALHLLCCIETLTRCQQLQLPLKDGGLNDKQKVLTKRTYTKEDFSIVNRFESHGGGWGYSGHSVEAIRFMPDVDILLGGFSLFGGRGEYMGKIKVFDLGSGGGEQEGDGELLAETDEIVYECGARQRYPLLFPQPVPLQANRWYLAWARVNGPSSDCGSGGQNIVTTEDQVTFTFKPSKKSNNGTDVNAGQIPQILFRVITHDSMPSSKPSSNVDVIHVISNTFAKMVTPDCFTALLSLTQWAWSALKAVVISGQRCSKPLSSTYSAEMEDLSRIIFVCRASLRLIRYYVLEVYPAKSKQFKTPNAESVPITHAIADVRTVLRTILSDSTLAQFNRAKNSGTSADYSAPFVAMVEQVVSESHETFVACFHVFYPTATLKWAILCELLNQVDKDSDCQMYCDRLLAAVLDSLCSLQMRLRSALPNLCDVQETLQSRHSYQSPDMEKPPSMNSPSDGSNSPLLQQGDLHQYPVLVEHMVYRSQVEGQTFLHRPYREVLDELIQIATSPVRQALDNHPVSWSAQLIRHACRLLARVVAELAAQACSTDDLDVSTARVVHITPSRFTTVSQNRSWNTGNGSPDAICFTVDRPNISIFGVGVFGGGGNYNYELELIELVRSAGDLPQTLSWNSLAVVKGTYGTDDCVNDIAEIKFDRPVPVKEHTRYTLRLRNQGGKTYNGDGGLSSVKGPDGTSFHFSACLLSYNGTNHVRGQFPYILYYNVPNYAEAQQSMLSAMESQVRKSVMSITSSIVQSMSKLLSSARKLPIQQSLPIISSSHVVSHLLPFMLASVGPVAESDPKNAVQVLELIEELLPHVSALCLSEMSSTKGHRENWSPVEDTSCITTSPHVVSVESDHPYRPATVSHYRVCFPDAVRWMCLEFDSQCCTAQVEDSLQIYLPSASSRNSGAEDQSSLSDYWPVSSKFNGANNWPKASLVLPGNEVVFSLETASDYVRNDKASSWGFRCSVVGYEWPDNVTGGLNGIRQLETELSYLGGMCAASLMKRDLSLPSPTGDDGEVDVDLMEDVARQIYTMHSSLLGKGLTLSHLPTIHEALEGNLPYSVNGKEKQFLRDLVGAVEETSGGRLARWLQPESVVDPTKCHLLLPGIFSTRVSSSTFNHFGSNGTSGASTGTSAKSVNSEEDEELEQRMSRSERGKTTVVSEGLRASWPTILTLLTRDQYGHLVHVPNLKVEIKAVPCDLATAAATTPVPRPIVSDATFGGHPNPSLDVPYEITKKEKMALHAITFMKAYENYSFEELRFMSPMTRRASETMLVRPNADGSYSANWTPSAAGSFNIHVTIDGYPLDDIYQVDVKEPPSGVLPPIHHVSGRNSTSMSSRLRQFRSRSSGGLRVRAQPSLQGEQIGIVVIDGTITFVEELCNDDGTWLRLGTESIKEWCLQQHSEAWCLQYNQHLGRTLLFPIDSGEASKENEPPVENTSGKSHRIKQQRKDAEKRETTVHHPPQSYCVVDCGASGHNIRVEPSLRALPVGKLKLGSHILVTEQRQTPDGLWVKLDPSSTRQFCFSADCDAWSLAVDRNRVVYLKDQQDMLPVSSTSGQFKAPFDFSESIDKQANLAPFSSPDVVNTFIFGPERDGIPPAPDVAQSSSVEAIGSPSSIATPSEPEAPPVKDPASVSPVPPPPLSMESSQEEGAGCGPLAAVAAGRFSALQRWLKRDGPPPSSAKDPPSSPSASRSVPPELQGVSVKDLVRVIGESRANGNASPPSSPNLGRKSSATGKTGRSSSAHLPSASKMDDISPTSELSQRSRSLSPAVHSPDRVSVSTISPSVTPKSVSQAGTQTSPEASKSSFSLGSAIHPDVTRSPQRHSPKMSRKERSVRGPRTRRSRSPGTASRSMITDQEPARLGISPSTAECLRAVFAATLWHQGLVQDAMACASFLKFHPDLPKQPDCVLLRGDRERKTKEEKARQRHSVEISSSNYLLAQHSSVLPVALEESWSSTAVAGAAGGAAAADGSANPQAKMIDPLLPALRLLVELWEKLSEHCLEVIRAEPTQPIVKEEPVKSSNKSNKETRDHQDKERKRKTRRSSIRHESNCELCGGVFPVPVTQHMRQAHPGCQKPALGLGYNPDGHYCGGWVGNCGEGGMQGSSWYLLCEDCRHRYLQQRRQGGEVSHVRDDKGKRQRRRVSLPSIPTQRTSGSTPIIASAQVDTHLTLKENAMFLLQLASSAAEEKASTLNKRRKSLLQQSSLSSVSEVNSIPHRKISVPVHLSGFSPSSGSFPGTQFQCLTVLKSDGQSQFSPCELNFNETEADILPEAEVIQRRRGSDGFAGRPFHRSVSMVTQPLAEHLRCPPDSSASSSRGRGSNGEEQVLYGGLSYLCSPSSALQRTVMLLSSPETKSSLPILDFVGRRHDLEALRTSMELALRKAACRVYAMQALAWLLRVVTQPFCLHDILWWLVSSLAPNVETTASGTDNGAESAAKKDNLVGQHPTSDVALAGEGLTPLLNAFHALLQTVSDLMQSLPMGTPLLAMAVRCWDVRFRQSDHAFLHRSHVFSNISRILSRCEEEAAVDIEAQEPSSIQPTSHVSMMTDVTEGIEIKVSSRSAMVSSLTDGSTETFWESGDEDRGKMKLITVHLNADAPPPRIVCIHVDNGRDLGSKVSGVTFKAGRSAEELLIVDVLEVESRFAGWLSAFLPRTGVSVIQMELKGPDNSLRVRQIRLLGEGGGVARSFNAAAVHQRTCETETLRVFRLLTSQVFGRLVSYEGEASNSNHEVIADADFIEMNGEAMPDGERMQDNDLKEHMVGILFSGKKLTHLQRQVCAHILQGIQRETIRLKEEWEAALVSGVDISQDFSSSRVSDSYCFELLSQVLALSGSRVGRMYISQQTTLPADLLSLLHTGSPRIQRQVTALLRRVLPEVPPSLFASLVGVEALPSTDYGILQCFDASASWTLERVGILDVLLACIAKALTLQVKTKGRDKETSSKQVVTSVTMATIFDEGHPLGSRWWMRGSMPRRVAESIIQLVKDMASGMLSESWSAVTKAAIAEAVLALTKMDEERRNSAICLTTPSLWLALAALCLLQEEHVDRLSSAQWANPRGAVSKPLCANHDDGETASQIVCAECGPLCVDCDRVLHLPKRFHSHQRQVCKEEEEAIKVDVHEGCGRVKLFWILALSEARNLKSLIEFRQGAPNPTDPAAVSCALVGNNSVSCRYCGSSMAPTSSLFDMPNVCNEPDCQEHSRNACTKLLSCGHWCGGVRAETECLPCLQRCARDVSLKQDADDMCMICFTEALSAAPSIQLSCKHIFHAHCCSTVLSRKWPGPRIAFGFAHCPICKAEMRHEYLNDLLTPIRELYDDVKRKALMRLEYEGLHQTEAITVPGSRFYQDPEGYAMERYAYYVCFKCNKAYYGGEARCEMDVGLGGEGVAGAAGGESFNPAELVCGGCSDVSRAQMCPRHGADYLEYKCRYCCSVAVFFCFGTTHFCNACHEDFRHVTEMPKHALPKCPAGPRGRQLDGDECPLHLNHPPTGEEFALGCGICRNAHTF